MIVVIGALSAARHGESYSVDGYAAAVALALAAAGEQVELIAKIGVDDAGESAIHQLDRGGVGHVALLREVSLATPSRPTEALPLDAADLQLALRYLTSFEAALLVDPREPSLLEAALDACDYAGARLVVTRSEGSEPLAALLPERNAGPPPLEVERPDVDPSIVTNLLIALLRPDREPPAAN